jgi:hypothetical protein
MLLGLPPRAKKGRLVSDNSLRKSESSIVEVGEGSEAMSALNPRFVSCGQSGCTDLIVAHLNWLVPGGSLYGANWVGGTVLIEREQKSTSI